jgi:hypothetical protein
MSVGNLKDYGNKGNNFPYQLGVIRLLQQIANSNPVEAIGYEKISIGAGVSSLTVPIGATYALIKVESDKPDYVIRYLELGAGTLPTATDGISKSNGDTFDVNGAINLANFRSTEVLAGVHTLHVQYYK